MYRMGTSGKSRTILRVVAESRWSKEFVQRVMGTPHDLTPVDDVELDSEEIDASEQPHEAEGEGHAEEGELDVPDAHAVPHRVRITIKDLKKQDRPLDVRDALTWSTARPTQGRTATRTAELASTRRLNRKR